MRLPTILLAAALVAPSAAAPQSRAKESAFGFTKGMTLKQVKAVAKVEKVPNTQSIFATRKPPAPVLYFSTYAVIVSPKVGVCAVMASSDEVPKDSSVRKSDIDRIAEVLSAKYGPPAEGPGDGDTTDLGVWRDPLGPGTAIRMAASSDKYDLNQSIVVFYYFSNFESCRAEEMKGL
jgi:hypothetical protein